MHWKYSSKCFKADKSDHHFMKNMQWGGDEPQGRSAAEMGKTVEKTDTDKKINISYSKFVT